MKEKAQGQPSHLFWHVCVAQLVADLHLQVGSNRALIFSGLPNAAHDSIAGNQGLESHGRTTRVDWFKLYALSN